jgi:urea transport system substrate-binding protein
MKKACISVILSIMALSFVLAGCGSDSTKSGSGNNSNGKQGEIKVGLVFSLSGSTSVSEKPMSEAALLAIDEINASGGVKGSKLVPVSEDYGGDPAQAATKAKKLVQQDKVAAIIGGYTSSSRQAMIPVVEQNKKVLVYPATFEGEEFSKNVIYTGAIPNQQIQALVPYLVKEGKKKFFLVGSDYNFPVEINKQVKVLLQQLGAEVVGEEYVPLGHSEFASIINKIKSQKPDVIFSTLISNSIPPFLKQHKSYGLDSKQLPIASPILAEPEVFATGAEATQGHISSQIYFPSIDTPENKKFVEDFRKKYGQDKPISANTVSAYSAVYLLAKALEKVADLNNDQELINAFAGLEFNGPQGKIKVDAENHHTWLYPRIAKIGSNMQFEILSESKDAVQAEPWAKLIFPNHEEPWKKK